MCSWLDQLIMMAHQVCDAYHQSWDYTQALH
jgi:hypothetical protein